MDQDLFERRRAIELSGSGACRPAPRWSTDDIRASWERCRTVARASIGPTCRSTTAASPRPGTSRRSAASRRTSSTQLVDSGRDAGMLTVVTDPAGQVLWGSAPPTCCSGRPRASGSMPGGRWDEPVAGTNGIAMALVTDGPAAVFATEHWCEPVRDWVCYSAPVHDAERRRRRGHRPQHDVGPRQPAGARHRRGDGPADGARAGRRRRAVARRPRPAGPRAWPGARSTARRSPSARARSSCSWRSPCVGTATLDELHAPAVRGPPDQRWRRCGRRSPTPGRRCGGAIASRPYRLTVPVRVDALDVLDRLRAGDLAGAVARYDGQLLPFSEAPLVVERRYHLDVALRTALLLQRVDERAAAVRRRAPVRRRGPAPRGRRSPRRAIPTCRRPSPRSPSPPPTCDRSRRRAGPPRRVGAGGRRRHADRARRRRQDAAGDRVRDRATRSAPATP